MTIESVCLRIGTDLALPGFVRRLAAEARACTGSKAVAVWLERETGTPSSGLVPWEPEREEYTHSDPTGPESALREMPLAELRRLRGSLPGGGAVLPAAGGRAASATGEALVAMPLQGGEACVGVLLASADPLAAAEVQSALLELTQGIAPLLASAIRMAALEDMVVRDDTVPCYNRRHLEDYLASETERAQRFAKPLSLIFFDLDDLKAVNTAHGHAAGSRVLRATAGRIASAIRRIDRLFRFGGDEFCVILPETDLEGAAQAAERVRRRVSGEPFLDDEIPGGLILSASLGVAAFPRHASGWEAMIAAADAAMRQVKTSGKNAVGLAGPDGGAAPPGL